MVRISRPFALTLVLGTCLLAADARTAKASFDINNVTTTSVGGGQTRFIYALSFGTEGGIRSLANGDYVTLYDVDGVQSISNSNSAGTAASQPISFSSALLGPTPAGLVPTDSPFRLNYTFTYTGSTLTANTTFYITLISNAGAQEFHDYAGQTTRTSNGTKVPSGGSGFTAVPAAVPEPASVILMGLGLAGFLGLSRLRRASDPSLV